MTSLKSGPAHHAGASSPMPPVSPRATRANGWSSRPSPGCSTSNARRSPPTSAATGCRAEHVERPGGGRPPRPPCAAGADGRRHWRRAGAGRGRVSHRRRCGLSAFRRGISQGPGGHQSARVPDRPGCSLDPGDARHPRGPRLVPDRASPMSGCGAGWSTIAMAREFPRAEVVGFDADEASVDDARANAAAQGVPVGSRSATPGRWPNAAPSTRSSCWKRCTTWRARARCWIASAMRSRPAAA